MEAVRTVGSVSVGLPHLPAARPVRLGHFDENRCSNAWYPPGIPGFSCFRLHLVTLSHPLATSQVEAQLSISAPHLGVHPKVPPWISYLQASCQGDLPLMVSSLGLMRVPPSPVSSYHWWDLVKASAPICKFLKTQGVEGWGMCLWYKEIRGGWKAWVGHGAGDSNDTTKSWLEGKASETPRMTMERGEWIWYSGLTKLGAGSLLMESGVCWGTLSNEMLLGRLGSGLLEAVVLKQVMLPPRGHLALSGSIFGCHS